MSCCHFEAELVDLGRGSGQGGPTGEALRAHLRECDACAARLAREQRLTAALRAVAEGTSAADATADMERRLLEAFDAHHAIPVARRASPTGAGPTWPLARHPGAAAASGTPPPLLAEGRTSRTATWWQLAAAAALVLAVVGGASVLRWRGAEPAPARPDGLAARVGAEGRAGGGADAAEIRKPAPGSPLGFRGSRAEDGAVRPGAARSSAARPAGSLTPAGGRPGRPGRAPSRQPVEDVATFIPLPEAAGLPALESGRIVRVELSRASLPAYGLELLPGGAHTSVGAYVLVGQDGLPRAIRLVNATVDSRRIR